MLHDRQTGQRPSRKTTGENRAGQRDPADEHEYPAAAEAVRGRPGNRRKEPIGLPWP
jgi:hypothetical protein